MMMMSNAMMFMSMFIVQYVFMSFIMTNKIDNISNSIGKVYMSTIMGLIMLLIMNYDIQNIAIFGGLLIAVIFLYRMQFGIYDKSYLNEMIEHHSMALLTSESILKKTNNSYVADIAQRIYNTQIKEIHEMQNLLRMIR